MTEPTFFQKHKIFLLLVAILGIAVLVSSFVITDRLAKYTAVTNTQLEKQALLLVELADLSAQNSADTETASVIQDCAIADRLRFDELLGQLDGGLEQAQLIELEQLFAVCASFYADRNIAMAAKLAREVEVFAAFVLQLDTLTTTDQLQAYNIDSWRKLADLEHEQGVQSTALVAAQKQIIGLLIDGKSADSPEIIAVLEGVQETKEAELFASNQAGTLLLELKEK